MSFSPLAIAKFRFARRVFTALICRQNTVVGAHHKRNPFGIVVKPTAQRGLLLGMCNELVLRSIFALICRQSGVVTTLGAIGGDGLYKAYCPLLTYLVSGSKCAAITANARQMHDKLLLVVREAELSHTRCNKKVKPSDCLLDI